MLSRKHYKALAMAVAKNYPDGIGAFVSSSEVIRKELCDAIIEDLCEYLKEDNHRFDKARFIAACKESHE